MTTRRLKAITLLAVLMLAHWPAFAAVVMPGAIMRTIPAAGGGSTVTEDNVGTPVSATTAQSVAPTVTVGAGANRLIVVSTGTGDSVVGTRAVDSVVSDQGGTFVKYDSIDEGVWVSSEIWYLVAPATATHTITVTWSSGGESNDQVCAQATSYTGVNQSTPFGAVAKASGNTGTSVSTGSITYSTGGLIYGTASSDSEGTLTTSAGTQRWQVLNVGGDTAYAGATRTTTGAITFTQSNNERYAVMGGLIQAAP